MNRNDQEREKQKESRIYKILFTIISLLLGTFYRVRARGKENLPEGACILCADHSHWSDPFLIAFALGINKRFHMMAKKELFEKPVVRWIVKSLGAFPVNRDASDVHAIRTALGYLRNGERIGIFPEGTRVSEDDAVAAKTGAVRLASHEQVPIVPIYIPRKKSFWHCVRIVIGEPYFLDRRIPRGDYDRLSAELMHRISALAPQENTK